MDAAVEHLGAERAGRYLRKFYPWYLERLGAGKAVNEALQATSSVAEARAVLSGLFAVEQAA
jgi:tRNA-dihydrouridine synthase B